MLLGTAVLAVIALLALGRCRRALWISHRYRFATWRWGRVVALLLVVGSAPELASLPQSTTGRTGRRIPDSQCGSVRGADSGVAPALQVLSLIHISEPTRPY